MRTRQLGPREMRWLKLLHVAGAAVWVGCGVALVVSQLTLSAGDGRELFGKLAMLDRIDLGVLVPGAITCFLTGIVYSAWTPWGWFKHRWIAAKWAICLSGVVVGTYPLGPWLSGLARLAKDEGLAALEHPTYARLLWLGTFQASTLVLAVVLTVFRPWRARAQRAATGPAPANRP